MKIRVIKQMGDLPSLGLNKKEIIKTLETTHGVNKKIIEHYYDYLIAKAKNSDEAKKAVEKFIEIIKSKKLINGDYPQQKSSKSRVIKTFKEYKKIIASTKMQRNLPEDSRN